VRLFILPDFQYFFPLFGPPQNKMEDLINQAHLYARIGDLASLQNLPREALVGRTAEGLTPFLTACASGQTKIAQWLLENALASPDETEPSIGASGFHLSAVRAQIDTLR